MMRQRVSNLEPSDSEISEDNPLIWKELESRRQQRQHLRVANRIWTHVEAFLWVLTAATVVYYGDGGNDMITLIRSDPRLWRSWLYAGAFLAGCNFLLFCYVQVWLRWFKNQGCNAERAVPWVLPSATLTLVASGLTTMVGLWPVYGLLSPVILLVLFMGLVMSFHFLPNVLPDPPAEAAAQPASPHRAAAGMGPDEDTADSVHSKTT